MNFSQALDYLRAGYHNRIARQNWNGKGMWLAIQHVELSPRLIHGESLQIKEYIGMKTADNCWIPWLASQTDILANDWVTVN